MVQSNELRVAFYSTRSGREPVREWMRSLDQVSEREMREAIETVRMGWPVGMPVARSLTKRLWEVRTRTPRGQARVIFCFFEGKMILLHGFIKKSAKTPQQDLTTALKRARELVGRGVR